MSMNASHQRFLVKFFKGNDLSTLEKEINEQMRILQLENYLLKDAPQILMVDDNFIILATFEFPHVAMAASKKNEIQKLKILSDKNIEKLEQKINSTIKIMEEKNFYLHQIIPAEKQSNHFVGSLIFRHCIIIAH